MEALLREGGKGMDDRGGRSTVKVLFRTERCGILSKRELKKGSRYGPMIILLLIVTTQHKF